MALPLWGKIGPLVVSMALLCIATLAVPDDHVAGTGGNTITSSRTSTLANHDALGVANDPVSHTVGEDTAVRNSDRKAAMQSTSKNDEAHGSDEHAALDKVLLEEAPLLEADSAMEHTNEDTKEEEGDVDTPSQQQGTNMERSVHREGDTQTEAPSDAVVEEEWQRDFTVDVHGYNVSVSVHLHQEREAKKKEEAEYAVRAKARMNALRKEKKEKSAAAVVKAHRDALENKLKVEAAEAQRRLLKAERDAAEESVEKAMGGSWGITS